MSDMRVEAITQTFQIKRKKSFAIKRARTQWDMWGTIIKPV